MWGSSGVEGICPILVSFEDSQPSPDPLARRYDSGLRLEGVVVLTSDAKEKAV